MAFAILAATVSTLRSIPAPRLLRADIDTVLVTCRAPIQRRTSNADACQTALQKKPQLIHPIHRIVQHIGIEVRAVASVSERIGLVEPSNVLRISAERRRVEAGAAQPHHARVLERAHIARGGDSIFVVGVDGRHRAGVVGQRDDAAALVGKRPGAVAAGVILDQRPASAVERIALLEHLRAVILRDRVRAVVNIIGSCGVLAANIDGKIKEMKKGSKKDEWLKVPYLIFSCNRAYRTKTAHPAEVYTAEQADRAIQATKALLEEFSDLLPDPIEEMIG